MAFDVLQACLYGEYSECVSMTTEVVVRFDDALHLCTRVVLSQFPWFPLTITLSALFFLFEMVLELRQSHHLATCRPPSFSLPASPTPTSPDTLSVPRSGPSVDVSAQPDDNEGVSMVDPNRFTAMQVWSLLLINFLMVEACFGFGMETLILCTGVLPWLWNMSLIMLGLVGYNAEWEIYRGVLFIFLVSSGCAILRIPFELYRKAYISPTSALNPEPMPNSGSDATKVYVTPQITQWARVQLKILLISICLGFPLLSLVLMLLKMNFRFHWLVTTAFVSVLTLIFTHIYPTMLAPLLNEFYNLQDTNYQNSPAPSPSVSPRNSFSPASSSLSISMLRRDIAQLTEQLDCPPLKAVYKVDTASLRGESHSNAFLLTNFTLQGQHLTVVLYDTLLEHMSKDEILAIIAHELGHYKMNHQLKALILQLCSVGMFVFLFSHVIDLTEFYSSFGFHDTTDASVGLVLFSYLYGPYANVVRAVTNAINRKFEFDADAFAVERGFQVERALIKMHSDSLFHLMPDRLYSLYHYPHPSLPERLLRIHELRKRTSQ
eukprot:TRINITY_DN5267_c0_g1_i3.p1 TRINITY_DN5267_c0_g1~~TRINITY_DN5267_c0_g1_i3.p1  ORF type:complete len:548 (-),score=72.03 TRINITY_DN5267_c0_g1_i3:8-1651(-)